MTKPKYIFLNGEIIPYSEGKVHVMSPCVRYGAMVFEGIRAYWNQSKTQLYIFRLRQHLRRLTESMKLMRFDKSYDIGELEQCIIKLIQKNEFREDVHIRPEIFIDGDVGSASSRTPVGIAISVNPMGRFLKENGVTAMVSSWRRIDDNVMPPRIKCAANYQNSRFALIEAGMHGYDTSIILNQDGKVAEEARACVFICRNGVPVTPPVTEGILESITRGTILQLFGEKLGIMPVERVVDRTEMYIADEAFLCGTGAEVTPIISIDGYVIPHGPMTFAIKEIYFEIVRGKSEEYGEWRTSVY